MTQPNKHRVRSQSTTRSISIRTRGRNFGLHPIAKNPGCHRRHGPQPTRRCLGCVLCRCISRSQLDIDVALVSLVIPSSHRGHLAQIHIAAIGCEHGAQHPVVWFFLGVGDGDLLPQHQRRQMVACLQALGLRQFRGVNAAQPDGLTVHRDGVAIVHRCDLACDALRI